MPKSSIHYVHKLDEQGWQPSPISDVNVGQSVCGTWHWKDTDAALSQWSISEITRSGLSVESELTEGETFCKECFSDYVKAEEK